MYKLIILALVLSGCAVVQNSMPIADNDRALIKSTMVVSTLGDDLYCSFVGFTIFNNKNKTYELGATFNQAFASNVASQLNAMGIDATPLARTAISYVNESEGAQKWANITLNNLPAISEGITNLMIFDGENHYASRGGYYARNNALKTSATLYVYEIPSGKLIGKSLAKRSTLKRSFSCTQESIPVEDNMLKLIHSSGDSLQRELVETLFLSGQK
ncbi:MAG: hypothetical protein V3W04_08640 [Gammaproteobacteria bacterium]